MNARIILTAAVIFILIIALVGFLCIGGVYNAAMEQHEEPNNIRFQIVEGVQMDDYGAYAHDCALVVDMETGVMYLWSSGSYDSFMTALLNSDGTPMIWEGYHD